ncbi:MAG: hypothetical protein IKG81_09450 [Bacteroidales bacterium]|nr:hypothetical protein [Bacteroidales bacterium]
MATASEFNELSALYEKEQNEEKKECLLNKMRANILERNGNNDEFITLLTNKTIRISQAGLSELINVSHNLVTKKNKNRSDDLNDAAREEQLKRNKYSKDNPYYKQRQ